MDSQDLEGVDGRVVAAEARLAAVEAAVLKSMAPSEGRRFRLKLDLQTEMARVFCPWRDSSAPASEAARRMNIIERRLTEIEEHLLANPPA